MTDQKEMPAPPQSRPSPNATSDTQHTVLHRLFGHAPHEPLTREDRDDIAAIVACVERGFRVAVKCRVCGHWLSSPKSVKAFVGPRCATKAVA